MIYTKTPAQVEKMAAAGALLNRVLEQLKPMVQVGARSIDIDAEAERLILSYGATPSFKGYNGFPYTICASVDSEVVHGFPTDKPLREGQILSVDCGLIYDGWQADSAFTLPAGKPSEDARRLMEVTEECFWLALEQAREGNRLGDIGWAVQQHAEKHGYGVIRDLCGHGIGREMHEDPSVPNYGRPGRGVRLREGMTIAIEPMIALKGWQVYVADNEWTVYTRDRSICSHYEHTVCITSGDPIVLTLPKPDPNGGSV